MLRKDDQPVWTDPKTGYERRHVSPRSDMPLDLVHIALPAGMAIPLPTSAYPFLRQLIWILEGGLVFIEGEVRHEMKQAIV